jgi:hypothetical protein
MQAMQMLVEIKGPTLINLDGLIDSETGEVGVVENKDLCFTSREEITVKDNVVKNH